MPKTTSTMFIDPNQEAQIKRQRALAQQMIKQGEQPSQAEMISGIVVPQSPLTGLVKALQQTAGGYFSGEADRAEAEQQKRNAQMYSDVIGKMRSNPDEAAAMISQIDPATGIDIMQKSIDMENKQKLLRERLKGGGGYYIDPENGEITGYNAMPPQTGISAPQNEWDREFIKQYNSLSGDPKAQAALKLQYAKNKLSPTEGQSNAALYASRIMEAMPEISKNTEALTSGWQSTLNSIPLIGNAIISPEKQQAEQAKRDFVNAILRRESGAVISPSEFANAEKQYFPKYGDSPEVIAQKEINRKTALQGIERAAGSSYYPKMQQQNSTIEKQQQQPPTDIDARITELRAKIARIKGVNGNQ